MEGKKSFSDGGVFLVKDRRSSEIFNTKFIRWLRSEGFTEHDYSKCWDGVNWVYVNIHQKQFWRGMQGIRITSSVCEHAITVDEFKTIYGIYSKYVGTPLLFVETDAIKMHLTKEPYYQIKTGEKTVELRLYDKKRRELNIEDEIKFILSEKPDKFFYAQITALHRFSMFRELFLTDLFPKCGFRDTSIEDAEETMRQYYSLKDEKKYGIVGIELRVL